MFVGMMAFQIMRALGVSVPLDLVELKACNEALHIVQLAEDRNVRILYPKDFWCRNESNPEQLQTFPSHSIVDGELFQVSVTLVFEIEYGHIFCNTFIV